MDNINIEIPSLPENIRIIESFIDNTKDRFKLNDDIYGNIMIAVTEAVNNAIRHGNKCDSDKNVKLNLAFLGTIIKFTVKDQGAGFDHTRLPDPTAPENLENPGGRGIFLIKHLSDEVGFSDSGRTIEISFYITD
ncbi:MAG: ATP-binding protein [Candidatus Nephrothrix sp. EaCA]|nr:MAG: ATP-binding protein [Candidatus Nephrothrix sp. EaCA]